MKKSEIQFIQIHMAITKKSDNGVLINSAKPRIPSKKAKVKSVKKQKGVNKKLLVTKPVKKRIVGKAEALSQKVFRKDLAAALSIGNYAKSLIEASLDPLFTISPEGKITDMNNASVKVTGTSREKLIGSNFFDYFTEPQKAREGYLEIFDKGFVTDYSLTIKDGKLTDVLFNGSVYKDEKGKVLGVVVVARDITEQKIIARELTEAIVIAELATEIAEAAKSKAENATRIAEDAVKAKQQFLSHVPPDDGISK